MSSSERRDRLSDLRSACRAPSCWRDAAPVMIQGATEVATVLCETHRRSYLGVSS